MTIAVLPWVVDAADADAGVHARSCAAWLAEAAIGAGESAVAPLVLIDQDRPAALHLRALPSVADARTWCDPTVEEIWLGGVVEAPGQVRLSLRRADRATPDWSVWLEVSGATLPEAWAALLGALAKARGWSAPTPPPDEARAWVHRARHLDASRVGPLVGLTHPVDAWRHLLEVVCRATVIDQAASDELVHRLRTALDDASQAAHAVDTIEQWCARQPDAPQPWVLAMRVAEQRGDEDALESARASHARACKASQGPP